MSQRILALVSEQCKPWLPTLGRSGQFIISIDLTVDGSAVLSTNCHMNLGDLCVRPPRGHHCRHGHANARKVREFPHKMFKVVTAVSECR